MQHNRLKEAEAGVISIAVNLIQLDSNTVIAAAREPAVSCAIVINQVFSSVPAQSTT